MRSEAYLCHGGGLFVRLCGLRSRLAGEDLVHRGKRVDALEEFLPVRVNGAGTVSGFLGVVLGSFSRNGTRGRNFALKRGGFDPGNVPLLPVELGAVIERHRHQPRVGVHRDEREPVLPLRVRGGYAESVFGRGGVEDACEGKSNNEQRKSLARRDPGERTCMPSRAKLMPSAGSGSSGGTSSAGSCTSHVPSGLPYRHRFSLSGSDWA